MREFDLSLLSKYRSQLMGLAALMIIICHMPAHHVSMPGIIAQIIAQGGLGVDIFLFLSGMGMWFSLKRHENKQWLSWLKKRYVRVLVPYLLITIPAFAIRAFLNHWSFGLLLWRLSTLSFWTEGWGAWFVSLIIVLYLITPVLFKLFYGVRKWVWLFILVSLTWSFSLLPIQGELFNNIQFGVTRIPCYLIGMASGDEIMKGVKISTIKLLLSMAIILAVALALKGMLEMPVSLFWIEGLLLLFISTLFIDIFFKRNYLVRFLNFMGMISLESYLTNVFVLSFFIYIPWNLCGLNLNPGNWTYYVVGTGCCILISCFVHQISDGIINRIKKVSLA